MSLSATTHFPTCERWYQTAPDPVVALRVYGAAITLPLTFTTPIVMGKGKLCDLHIQKKYLAVQQARLTWANEHHGRVIVTNLSKTNDIVCSSELAERELTLGAGDSFSVGKTSYYLLNEQMRVAFPWLLEYLGSTNYKLVDDLMIAALMNATEHLFLLGPAGCAQDQVASHIRQISRRRHNLFASIEPGVPLNAATRNIIRTASNGGTIFVDLHKKGTINRKIAEALTGEEAKVRLILSAPSPSKLRWSFPDLVNRVRRIDIPSILQRKEDIPELIDRWAVQEESALRHASLRAPLRRAIEKYDWPGNFDELYAFAAFLRQLAPVLKEDSPRQVERDSAVLRSTRESWEKKLGLKIEIPLMPGGNGRGKAPAGGEHSASKTNGSDDDS